MIVITTIDVLPDYCYKCPCHDGESGYCQADKEQRHSEYRPYWCPLKEIHNDQKVGEVGMIDREKVIESLDNALVQMHGCGRYTPEDVDELETAAWKALELLKEQEVEIEQLNRFVNGFSRDAMPVVMCKDCRKRDKEECPMYVDYPCTNKPGDDWFCADGERNGEIKVERTETEKSHGGRRI